MNKFLEMYNLLRQKQEEIENMKQTAINEIKLVIKYSQETKVQDQMASRVNSTKYLQKS